MKTIDMQAVRGMFSESAPAATKTVVRRKHGARSRRPSAWRILASTIAGFPAFLWQLSPHK